MIIFRKNEINLPLILYFLAAKQVCHSRTNMLFDKFKLISSLVVVVL